MSGLARRVKEIFDLARRTVICAAVLLVIVYPEVILDLARDSVTALTKIIGRK